MKQYQQRAAIGCAGGPTQLVSAPARPASLEPPTHATYPAEIAQGGFTGGAEVPFRHEDASGRTRTAVGAGTVPIAGSSQAPRYLASIH